MSGPSNRTRTGAPALRALETAIMLAPGRLTETSPNPRRAPQIAAELDRLGYIIVPKPYKQPADRGDAAKQIAKRNAEAIRDARR